jgi:hypothetical protein
MISRLIYIASIDWVVHYFDKDKLLPSSSPNKMYCISDIKIDYSGRLIIADLDQIYQLDVNDLQVKVLAQSYTACTIDRFIIQMTKGYVYA